MYLYLARKELYEPQFQKKSFSRSGKSDFPYNFFTVSFTILLNYYWRAFTFSPASVQNTFVRICCQHRNYCNLHFLYISYRIYLWQKNEKKEIPLGIPTGNLVFSGITCYLTYYKPVKRNFRHQCPYFVYNLCRCRNPWRNAGII